MIDLNHPPDERSAKDRNRPWVVKVGSALITAEGQGLNHDLIDAWAKQIHTLAERHIHCVVVSSGAIVAGMQRLGWSQRPHMVARQQAAAAVGQSALMHTWEQAFASRGRHSAQILLTHADLANRVRYLNAGSTLRTLLRLDVVPVVNENDSVVNEEIRFGDNDTLAALVANLIEAKRLIILTDQIGLFDKDPRHHDDAKLVSAGAANDTQLEKLAGPGGEFGRGGMLTKLKAAQKAARSGTDTIIAWGREPDVLVRLADDEPIGTRLTAGDHRWPARKQWMAGQLRANGTLTLDEGAVRVLRQSGKSLLPVGVTDAEGAFGRGDLVICLTPKGEEVARGLVNYSGSETRRIIGQTSNAIESTLGYVYEPELIHRDNMVVSTGATSPSRTKGP